MSTPDIEEMKERKSFRRAIGTFIVGVATILLLFAVLAAAFTAYVAYAGQHPFRWPDAFDGAPRVDAERLGAVLESGLSWAMRVCGTLVVLIGAALAVGRGSTGNVLNTAVVVLAGLVLIAQHWAAGIPLCVLGLAYVVGTLQTVVKRPPPPPEPAKPSGFDLGRR